jgi:two-component system, NtrC family, sensor kinase
LEQQTATSEILRVISSSPTDLQPVMNAVADNAAQLCEANDAHIFLKDGNVLRVVASHGALPLARQEVPISRHSVLGRAVSDRRPIHVEDLAEAFPDEFPEARRMKEMGYRTILVMPLLRQGEPLGAIVIRRTEVRPFSRGQVALLQTFADQAVIAIENVRLFKELQSSNRELSTALDTQTATSEILRVISQSPTEVQPVFEAIVASAVKLCDGLFGTLWQFDGELIHQVAQHNYTPEALEEMRRVYPCRPSRAHGSARAILERAVVHIPDVEVDPEFRLQALSRAVGWRSGLFVPMLRDGAPIGVIAVSRARPGPFADNEIELLRTFADQAVIAIENVRLFKELETRNRDLTAALDQQTATSEILRVISSSPTDVQPVFDAIVRSAGELCEADFGGLHLLDAGHITLEAHYNAMPGEYEVWKSVFPTPVGRHSASGRAILDRVPVQINDVRADPDYGFSNITALDRHRTLLAVPMLREGEPIGTISVWRGAVRPFTDKQIALLQTFADQAVIAIENVRLFKELEARTQDLTRSVGELRALGEVGQAISSTLDLQTVLSTIVARATQLSGVDAGVIYEYDAPRELFEPRATEGLEEGIVRMLVATPIRKGQGVTGRLADAPEPIQVADVRDLAEQVPVRDAFVRAGYRSLLAVPLVREGQLIGGLTVIRKATGEFAREVIDLLRTFATQSALAIQNARLFREIEDKSRQLEVASQHKSEFLANMSHELRTPLNAIIGFSEVLTERMFGDLNEKQQEYLKDIYASGTHLLSLINDILDLSKIEAGRMELELTDFDLPTAIDNALILVRERAGRRGIALEHSVDERLGEIRGDERKVKQVLLNLLSNALKFTPEGGRVEVRAGMVDGMAEIAVTDTGVGIAPEDQEKVFEEFRQVGTVEKKAEGTGLGLTLCRKFIELHGGRIWVKSQVGVGSTFTFTIPVRRGE